MLKKTFLLLTALLLAVAAHLRPCWDYTVAGEASAPVSIRAAALAEETARRAAEEILPGEPPRPQTERRLRLRLRRPEGDARSLSDALLRATEGVALCDEVSVDGRRLGWVEEAGELREALRGYIARTLPTWAEGGLLGRELRTRRLYTRSGRLTPTRDMLLLVTGAAPVFYYDGNGRIARA